MDKNTLAEQEEVSMQQGGVSCCCTADDNARKTVREENLRNDLLKRLSRVEGQIRGVKGMIERDAYCDDVLNQIAAARAALKSISSLLLESHIHGCLVRRIRDGEDVVVDELLATINKLM